MEALIGMASATGANPPDRGVPEPECAGSGDDEILFCDAAVCLPSVMPSAPPLCRTISTTETGKYGQPI